MESGVITLTILAFKGKISRKSQNYVTLNFSTDVHQNLANMGFIPSDPGGTNKIELL
jgi:hypothetical protein